MRVGLVSGEYPPQQGGVGDFTRELARALAEQGVDVHVITPVRSAAGMHDHGPRTEGERAGPQAAGGSVGGVTVHPIVRHWSFLALWRVRALARSLRLDLINLQYQAAAYGLTAPIHFLPHWAGVPVVVTFHDLRVPYLFPKAGRLRPAALTHLARASAGVIATDPADELELKRRGGVRRLARIPIGSNIAPAPPPGYDRAAWRAGLGVSAADVLLGYFGFLNASKGVDTLMSALATLHDRRAAVRLLLIGGATGSSDATNAAFEAQINRMIARYDLEARIIRTGFVDAGRVSGHLLACDALVLPYRDGVSFRRGSLLAALAHGRAVITTQPRERLPEIVDGLNMRLVPPESAPAIVLAVTELLDAPELRARLEQGARQLAASFTWDVIASQTLAFYGSI